MDEGSWRRDKVSSKFDGRMIREFLEARSEFQSYETTTAADEVFKQTSGVVQIPFWNITGNNNHACPRFISCRSDRLI